MKQFFISLLYIIIIFPKIHAQKEVKSYFDCDYYQYLNIDTTAFEWNNNGGIDSQRVAIAKRLGFYRLHPHMNVKYMDQQFSKSMTAEILGIVDTNALKFVLAKYDIGKDTIAFLITLYSSNILFHGQIIDKRYEIDPNICFKLRTSYVIRIDSILYSYLPVKRGDLILAKQKSGPMYNCSEAPNYPDSLAIQFVRKSNERIFDIGDTAIFLLQNRGYLNGMLNRKIKYGTLRPPHEEDFCENYFTIKNSIYKYDYKFIHSSIKKANKL